MFSSFRAALLLAGSFCVAPLMAQNPTIHQVPATPETTTVGRFNLHKPPVLKINSGDTVSMETWYHWNNGAIFNKTSPADVAKFFAANGIPQTRGQHTLTGPVYINGAVPGDVLEIRILGIKLKDFGFNFLSPSAGILSEFTKPRIKYFKFDKKNNTTEFLPDVCMHLEPFPGILAVAPPLDWPAGWPVNLETAIGQPVPGEFHSVPPGPFGGNLDQVDLKVGTVIFLPVFQQGALLWTGDSHALQGNGEIDLTALETAFEGITMQVIVRKDLKAEGVLDSAKRKSGSAFTWPILENRTHWLIVGLNVDLFEAMKLAARNGIDFLVRTQGFSPEEAYQFLSMMGDFKIAEVVDIVKNVTLHIPKEPFRKIGKKCTLCDDYTFPLSQEIEMKNAPCVPQEGKVIQ